MIEVLPWGEGKERDGEKNCRWEDKDGNLNRSKEHIVQNERDRRRKTSNLNGGNGENDGKMWHWICLLDNPLSSLLFMRPKEREKHLSLSLSHTNKIRLTNVCCV